MISIKQNISLNLIEQYVEIQETFENQSIKEFIAIF